MISNNLNDSDKTTANVPSTDVYTSYIFSTSNRSLSKYGERLLMEVISVAQEYTIDAALGIHKLNFGEKYKEKFAIIDIPVKNLLNEDDTTNYTKAKEAAVELMKIYHTVEAPVLDEQGKQRKYKDGSPQYKFASFHLLDKVIVNEKPGIVSVKLGEDTWSQILDMGKGYTRYNLLTAKRLDNVVAIRLFQIMSNTSESLDFSLERIKGILGLQDKYVNNPTGFIKRVIVPAEKEIEEKCSFKVEHDLIYESSAGKGRPSICGLTFRKITRPLTLLNPSAVLGTELLNILVKTFGFDDRGIRSNIRLFQDAREKGVDIFAFLEKIETRAKQATIPQAYVIRSLQNLLEGKHHSNTMETKPSAKNEQKAISDESRQKTKNPKNLRFETNPAEAFSNSGLEEL